MKLWRQVKGIRGKRAGGEPEDEAEHFYRCPICGQSVDKRELGEVFYHTQPNHEPMPRD
jgi:hypothetical protein